LQVNCLGCAEPLENLQRLAQEHLGSRALTGGPGTAVQADPTNLRAATDRE
jgi:hypothetical protein